MTGRPIGRDTVTRRRAAPGTDGHGNATKDWTAPDLLPIKGCNVQPGASIEYLLGRDETLVAYTVMAPLASDVTATDRMDYAGKTFEVYGEPALWPSPSGRNDYLLIYLQKWNG